MRLTQLLASALLLSATTASGETPAPRDESVLGEIPVTGTAQEHVIKLAILPSLSPDMEDVIVRGVVRRDFELTGMFQVIDDKKAPPGLYGFDDAVDVQAWRNLGAEVIIKVAARRKAQQGKVEVFGLAYFIHVGKDPVYEKMLTVDEKDVRVTAHRITDALLGAITGREGAFASQLGYSSKWGRDRRVFRMDADGHDLKPLTPEGDTAIAPAFGPEGALYYSVSHKYSPFELVRHGSPPKRIHLPVKGSVYSVAFDAGHTRMAVAVSEPGGSAVYVGGADGSNLKKVSTTEIATHPVFSPSGKLAWVGGGGQQGTQRIYVDGKAASPAGFTASAPTFCDTEDGIRLVFAVAVGGERQDLVMTNERGGGIARLTQGQGSNGYPACSPDGRLLAFFSTRGGKKGIYLLSLKRWGTQLLSTQHGESLRWERLPPPPAAATTATKP